MHRRTITQNKLAVFMTRTSAARVLARTRTLPHAPDGDTCEGAGILRSRHRLHLNFAQLGSGFRLGTNKIIKLTNPIRAECKQMQRRFTGLGA
jgi:hypothetical protein